MTATTRPQPSPDPDQSEMPSRYANWRLLVPWWYYPHQNKDHTFTKILFQFLCKFPPQPRADPAAKVCSTIDTGLPRTPLDWSPSKYLICGHQQSASQPRSSQLRAGCRWSTAKFIPHIKPPYTASGAPGYCTALKLKYFHGRGRKLDRALVRVSI